MVAPGTMRALSGPSRLGGSQHRTCPPSAIGHPPSTPGTMPPMSPTVARKAGLLACAASLVALGVALLVLPGEDVGGTFGISDRLAGAVLIGFGVVFVALALRKAGGADADGAGGGTAG